MKCLHTENKKLKCLNIKNLQKHKNAQEVHQIQVDKIANSQPIIVQLCFGTIIYRGVAMKTMLVIGQI